MTSDEPLPDRCAAKCRDGGYCENYPVGDKERCRMHGGKTPTKDENPNVGAPENNVSASTHGLYVDVNSTYQKVLSDEERELVDDIFADYVTEYTERHGEPPTGHEAELFRIAVSYGKHVHADEWSIRKPDELDSGNATVDRETHISESGQEYYRYKETVVAKGQGRLSKDRRAWLKDLGLMQSPEDRQADALEGLKHQWKQSAQGNGD